MLAHALFQTLKSDATELNPAEHQPWNGREKLMHFYLNTRIIENTIRRIFKNRPRKTCLESFSKRIASFTARDKISQHLQNERRK